MDRGAWWETAHGVTESGTTDRLSTGHKKELKADREEKNIGGKF